MISPKPISPAARIGHVHLRVADLERALAFYCDVLGFELIARIGAQAAFISAGGYHHHIGLNTWESLGGSPPAPGSTGLFHLAILYPTRADLADALLRLMRAGISLDGAADHGVSEALYLRDPDENGVELYCDRPRNEWPRDAAGGVEIYTRRLDLDRLLAEAAPTAMPLKKLGPSTRNQTNKTMINNTKDLTKRAATSPRHRTGGYAILSRMADKARADIAGKIGDYHTDCPLDNMLLNWKGVKYAGVRKALEAGATDEEIVSHINTHGTQKTPEEIRAWSDSVDRATMHGDPEKGEWFDSECRKLGLDPAKTTMFEWLEADDRASFAK